MSSFSGRGPGLGLVGATSLAITIVIGSGALILPGIAYREAGHAAVWAWVFAAVLVLPLLAVLGRLGQALPGAAGVAGYLRAAFGPRAAAATETLLIGTFCVGIPGIALAGGHYLAATVGLSPDFGAAGAIAMVAASVLLNCTGTRLSGAVQSVLCALLLVALVTIALCGVLMGTAPRPEPLFSSDALVTGLAGVGTVFFAFTGWELVSFTTGEYARPKRDFPWVLAISYLVVTALYVLLSLAVQSTLVPEEPHLDLRPMELVMHALFGGAASKSVAAMSTVLLLASVLGNSWGASRLVMSSASEGLLPAGLREVNRFGVPHRAVVACGIAFGVVIAANSVGLVSIASILGLAGKNFLLLYLLCCAAHFKLFRGVWDRTVAVVGATLLAIPLFSFEWASLAWSAALLTSGFALGSRQKTSDESLVRR
ncbi:APC family permease [Streptomyces macrosporus]|uniref:Amino acid permease n=1 Tax=Streptomyces macrosporus TaxID=44032 RepID=A0ABP5WJX7_9ACTN